MKRLTTTMAATCAALTLALGGASSASADEDLPDGQAQQASTTSAADDAALANADLQNVLQREQQTLVMMSNVSKMLYDTAQSVIRKIGS